MCFSLHYPGSQGPHCLSRLPAVQSRAGSQVDFWQQEAGNWITPCLQSVFDGPV